MPRAPEACCSLCLPLPSPMRIAPQLPRGVEGALGPSILTTCALRGASGRALRTLAEVLVLGLLPEGGRQLLLLRRLLFTTTPPPPPPHHHHHHHHHQ